MSRVSIKMICPYPNNYNCICRQGLHCGGYIMRHPPNTCPYYKHLTDEELAKIETYLYNKCDMCDMHSKSEGENTGFCKAQATGDCHIIKLIFYIAELRRKNALTARKAFANTNNTITSSGMTFRGKGTQ